MGAIPVNWMKCGDDHHWCDFYRLDLSGKAISEASGVYIIFYLGQNNQPGKVVRVGQGDIADRLLAHRDDPDIAAYKGKGLLVTWARVHGQQQDGVENYLFNTFSPLVGERCPDCDPIEVNSPFE